MLKKKNPILPYEDEKDLISYSGFFKDLAKKELQLYFNGHNHFDPNISDQLCHLRAFWFCDLDRQNENKDNLQEETLETIGQGILLNKCFFYDMSQFGMFDKLYEIHKDDFERLVNQKFSNRYRSNWIVGLKSNFSRRINDFVNYNYLKHLDCSIKNELQFHFSNFLHFSQKHVKIPFVPFFSSGYVFLEMLKITKMRVVMLYRHFIIDENNDISLNGIEFIPIVNNQVSDDYSLLENPGNVVLVEAYSCNFVNHKNKYSIDFYKEKKFKDVCSKMVKEFNFEETVLAGFAIHDPFHQQPKLSFKDEAITYEFNDVSEEYNNIMKRYREKALELGTQLIKWDATKQRYLNEDVSFNVFHIYAYNMANYKKYLEDHRKYLHKKYPLNIKYRSEESKPPVRF